MLKQLSNGHQKWFAGDENSSGVGIGGQIMPLPGKMRPGIYISMDMPSLAKRACRPLHFSGAQ